jgi:hypothetical protein
MNFNNSKYDDIRNKVRIEQAWCRQFFHNIHSCVRVKIQGKNLSFIKKHLLGIKEKDKNMNSIGIQTIMRTQIDRQISCNLIKVTPVFIRKSRSETSISDEKSTDIESTSK